MNIKLQHAHFSGLLAGGLMLGVVGLPSGAMAAENVRKNCPGRDLYAAMRKDAPEQAGKIAAAAKGISDGQTRLWKIEHEEFPDRLPSFLYGYLPAADSRVNGLTPAVSDALAQSRRIAFGHEAISAERLAETMGAMPSEMLLPKGKSLAASVGADAMVRITNAARQSGVDLETVHRLQPWLASMLLATSECQLQFANSPSAMGFERVLAQIAENRGMGTLSLTGLDRVFKSMSTLSDASQASLMKAALNAQNTLDDQAETQVQLYLKRDVASVSAFSKAMMVANGASAEAVADFDRVFYQESNVTMRDRSLMHVAYGGLFMALEAPRLPGDRGMVFLLRDAGYKLTAID